MQGKSKIVVNTSILTARNTHNSVRNTNKERRVMETLKFTIFDLRLIIALFPMRQKKECRHTEIF
jgi:hypothetical protein